MRRKLKSILLSMALAAFAGSAFAVASPVSLLPVKVEAVIEGGVAPDKLPPGQPAPVSLRLAERVQTPDGSHPPALQELQVEMDRHLALDVAGLASCHPSLDERRATIAERCGSSQVGRGKVDIELAFPEEPVRQVEGSLQVFNGGAWQSRTSFWLYAHFPAPIAGSLLMPLKFQPHPSGRFGSRAVLELPKIANGAASLTYLGVRFRKGIFSASCPNGELQERANASFADGTFQSSGLVRTCKISAAGG